MAIYYTLLSVPLSNILTTVLLQYPVQHTEEGFLIDYPAQPGKEALSKFGLASLQGTVFTVVSAAISLGVVSCVFDGVKNEKSREKYSWGAFVCTMVVCGLAAGGAARAFPDRLGTPIEVLANFAVSSVTACLTAYMTRN